MTTISILSGDFEILFDDETVGGNAVAGMKMVRRASGATSTVYTTNQLYSAIADVTDDFVAMGFENPMLPVTPNAYTMENNYFIPRSSTEWLEQGAISADWTVVSGEGVYRKAYGAVAAAPVASDIGRQVIETDTGDTGTLLDFETEPDGTTVIWIRPDTSGDTFADVNSQLECTTDSGTMDVTATEAAISGTSLWSSIQVIGSVPTATEVYLYQNRFKMTDSIGGFQWWTTDTTQSLGIIDILIRVINAGVTIADGDVEVFARRYTSLYDNFRLNVVTGGRSALPLASAPDINNTTGYRAALYDGGTGSAMAVGDILTNTTVSGGVAVVTFENDGGATGDFEYYLVGELIDFSDDDDFTSTNRNGTIMGSPTNTLGGPTDSTAGEGGTVTITLGTTTFDHDGDNTAEPYSVTIDAQGDVSAASVYERIKYVTRRGADETVLFGAGVNVPGESYRGLEVQAFYDNPAGSFTEGDDVTGFSGYTARVISVNTSDAYVVMTDQQTSLDTISDDDTLTDESADTVDVMGSPVQFTSPKSSPFGTFTGTQIFGARGILYANPASADIQNYILTDDNGTLRTPPNTVSFTVTNTAAGDRVFVARDTGTSGVIDKDQFGGLAAPSGAFNGLADIVIRVAGSIDSEVPAAGYVRVVETSLQQEHHYVYDSLTLGANDEFNLRDIDDDGSATSASSTQLIDTTADFTSPLVLPGMLVRNTFAGKTTHVWEVTNVVGATTLDVVPLYGPLDATQDWDVGDTFTINALIGDHTAPADYAATDDVYDLVLDSEATTTSAFNSFVKTPSSNFGVVVNVRQGKLILPFTQNVTVGDSGASVTVVRTPDTIAT